MQDAKFETRYLLALLSAVVNEKKPPVSVRRVDWESLFKIADFQNVANVAYYGILALDDEIPDVWRERFFEKYQESVIESERLQSAIEVLTWQLERNKIDCVLLDKVMSQCYTHPEMRRLDELEILTERRKERTINQLMESMDYEKKENRKHDGLLYSKVPGIQVMFYNRLGFVDRKVRKYYWTVLQRLLLMPEYRHIHEFSVDEFYIYLISDTAKKYACAEIDVRAIMDIWLYYVHYREELNWTHINRELRKLGIQKFAEQLFTLAGIWFNGEHNEEMGIYEAMESYILTKGVRGREISSELLPLIKQVADFYERDKKREWIKEQVKWVFPNKDYMMSLYPVIRKVPILIVGCWIIRLLRAIWFVVKGRMKAALSQTKRVVKDFILEVQTKIFRKKDDE